MRRPVAAVTAPRFPNLSLLLFMGGSGLSLITRLDPFYEWFYTWLGGRLGQLSRTEADREAAGVWARDAYVIAMFVLSVGAWLATGLNEWLNLAIVVYAAWRVSQLVAYKLKIVLVDINQPGHYVASVSRSIMQGIVSVAEVMVLFAALDHALAPAGFVDASQQPVAMPKTAGGWLYVSWTSLLTLGSTYSPRGGTAKFLLMIEVAAGLILIAVSLGSFVGAVRLEQWNQETANSLVVALALGGHVLVRLSGQAAFQPVTGLRLDPVEKLQIRIGADWISASRVDAFTTN